MVNLINSLACQYFGHIIANHEDYMYSSLKVTGNAGTNLLLPVMFGQVGVKSISCD